MVNQLAVLLPGKVPPSWLVRAVFPYLGQRSRRILIPPGIGRDAAAILYRNKVLVFSTDPITGTATHIGAHSVIINANDIATTGARPLWYLCTLLLPAGMNERTLRQIMKENHETSKSMGISVIGGHSEATHGLTRPIIAGFMVGEAHRGKLLMSGAGREGDRILLTKTAGLEGTAILATQDLSRLRGIPEGVLQRAKKLFGQLSLVKEALALANMEGVHAMHDPTEGGVLNGLWELAEASGLGIEVSAGKIPVTPETREICSKLRLDPLKLMSSGALLIAASPRKAPVIARRIMLMKIRVSEVARLKARSTGRLVYRGTSKTPLKPVSRDELYKLS